MLESFSLWLHETAAGKALLTMFISMLPVVELAAGFPQALQWDCRSTLRFSPRSSAT